MKNKEIKKVEKNLQKSEKFDPMAYECITNIANIEEEVKKIRGEWRE